MPVYTVLAADAGAVPVQHPVITLVGADGAPYNPATGIPSGTYAVAGNYARAVEVDDFYAAGVTVDTATPTQHQAAIVAAVATGGSTRPVRFRPGKTYLTTATFLLGTSAHLVAHGATIAADPASPGHYLVRNATESSTGNPDITIEGGTWNPRGDVLAANGSWLGHGIYFRNCDRLKLSGLKITKALKWAILVADSDDIDVGDITFDTLSDGLHCHGPMARPYIHNLRGTTGDDFLAFTTNDYPGYATSVGDFRDIEVDGLYPVGSVTAAALCGDPGHSFLGSTTIRNVKGSVTTAAIRAVNDPNTLTQTVIESLTLAHIHVDNANSGAPIVNLSGSSIRDVVIDDLLHTNTQNALLVGPENVITTMVVSRLRSPKLAAQALVSVLGRCDELIFDGVTAAMASGGKVFQVNGTVARAVLGGVFTTGGTALFVQTAGASAMDVFVQNAKVRNLDYGFLLGATCTIHLANAKFDTIPNYLFNLNSAAAVVRVLAGVVVQTGVTLPVGLTAGATFSANGEMLVVDTSGGNAINAAVAGDRVRDRVTGEPQQYNGTAWVAAYGAPYDTRPVASNAEEIYVGRNLAGQVTFGIRGDSRGGAYAGGESFRRIEWKASSGLGPGGYGGIFFGRGNVDADAGIGRSSGNTPSINSDCPMGPKAYTTAGRPAANAVPAGSAYYDATVSKPVWSDGTTWRDAAGAAV